MKNPVCASMLVAMAGACAVPAIGAQITGPSSSPTPYLVPAPGAPVGINVKSILTVGDTVPSSAPAGGNYRMVGIPDGLGAYDNNDGTFTLLMNHELGNTSGVVRAHGQTGSFVSRWNINKASLQVNSGRDQITSTVMQQGNTAQFGRFCSADLALPSAYFNPSSGLGTQERIFMNGEENGNEGRAMGHVVTGANNGTSFQLPLLGRFSWENSVANTYAQDKTIVMGTDDNTVNGGVYMYLGTKTNSGTEVDRAGLTNGNLYGVKISGVNQEDRNAGIPSGTRFSLFNHGDVSGTTGAQLDTVGAQVNSGQNNVTAFNRPEDGCWNPSNPNEFFFVTTDRYNNAGDGSGSTVGRSRLWRMTYDDITNPTAGGKIDMLVDGSEGGQMFDNITVDRVGNVLIQEDVGNNQRSGMVWNYNIAAGNLTPLLIHDPARFGNYSPATAPYNQDEESSGIIDASDLLGQGWFLLDVQAHYGQPGELVEGGQLLAFYNPIPTPGAAGLIGMGGLALIRRKRN